MDEVVEMLETATEERKNRIVAMERAITRQMERIEEHGNSDLVAVVNEIGENTADIINAMSAELDSHLHLLLSIVNVLDRDL